MSWEYIKVKNKKVKKENRKQQEEHHLPETVTEKGLLADIGLIPESRVIIVMETTRRRILSWDTESGRWYNAQGITRICSTNLNFVADPSNRKRCRWNYYKPHLTSISEMKRTGITVHPVISHTPNIKYMEIWKTKNKNEDFSCCTRRLGNKFRINIPV